MVIYIGPPPAQPTAPAVPPPSSGWQNWYLFAGGDTGQFGNAFIRAGYVFTTWQIFTGFGVPYLLPINNYFNISISLQPTGDLLAAVQAAGSGHYVVGVQRPTGLEFAFIYNTGVSPRAWFISASPGFPSMIFTAATGLAAGDGLDMAGGLESNDVLAVQTGPASRFADDGFTYGNGGVPPSQVNRFVWETGQSGVYIGAAVGGVVKTIDNGLNWGYVRPHAGIGSLWPAGAVGRDISFLGVPRPNPALAPLFVVGTTIYQKLGDDNIWENVDGAPPATTGRRLRYYGNGKMLHQTGTNGQIRYSGDKGVTWTTRALPASVETITGYDVSPDGTVWVLGNAVSGADTGYIYSSVDNGANWVQSLNWSIDAQTGHIAVNPINSNQIVAIYGIASGQIRGKLSLNGGVSWSTITISNLNITLDNAASGAILWVGTRLVIVLQETSGGHVHALWSDDQGANWTESLDIDTGTTGTGNLQHFISGGIFGPLFIALNYTVVQTTSRILRSVDQGETWDQMSVL